jgi:hypothetical protein
MASADRTVRSASDTSFGIGVQRTICATRDERSRRNSVALCAALFEKALIENSPTVRKDGFVSGCQQAVGDAME